MTPETVISEAVSEKRRGRPSRYRDGLNGFLLNSAKQTFDRATVRTDQGHAHVLWAMAALSQDAPTSWLWPGEEAIRSGRAEVSMIIMEALGRLEDDEEIRRMAAEVAALKPMTAREAVQCIRRARRVTRGASSLDAATEAIRKVVNAYLLTHQDGWEDVVEALLILRVAMIKQKQEAAP